MNCETGYRLSVSRIRNTRLHVRCASALVGTLEEGIDALNTASFSRSHGQGWKLRVSQNRLREPYLNGLILCSHKIIVLRKPKLPDSVGCAMTGTFLSSPLQKARDCMETK